MQCERPLPDHIRNRLDEVEIRCRLVLGDLEGSIRILKMGAHELETVELVARLDLSAGRPDRAADRLASALDPAASARSEIERLLLLARAQLQLGDEFRADGLFGRAIDRGRAERFIRVFLDDAPELIGSLHTIASRLSDSYVMDMVSRTDHVGRRSRQASSFDILEPLTQRERELLSYLPSHLSQQEIAGLMYISLNTVKSHTKAIYRKLGAASRSKAVYIAHSHGLL